MNCPTDEIQTWIGQIDHRGRLQLPDELCQQSEWTGPGNVILECDGISVRVLTVAQYVAETFDSQVK